MAGFIDADGYISITSVSKTKSFVPKLSVTNCKKEIIELFVREFGGKVRKRVWNKEGKENWNDCYEWSLTNQKAAIVVDKLYDHIFLKKEQARLLLQAAELKKSTCGAGARWHREDYNKVQECLLRLKNKCLDLNKRGKQNVAG